MANRQNIKVIIMGAGPAGLAAGYQLSINNIKVDTIEAQEQIGGLSKTIVKNGFRFDIGSHRWFTKIDELNLLVEKLLGKNLIEVRRSSRILFDGQYFDYPIKISNALKGLGLWRSLKAIFSYFNARLKYRLHPQPLKTFEDWIVAHFGRVLFNYFFKTYTEKLWGVSCRQIGAEWATQRIKGLSLFTALKTAIFPSKNRPKSLIDKFKYPIYGIGNLWKELASEINKEGNDISLMSTVLKINHKNSKIQNIIVEKKNHNKKEICQINSDEFISSIPITNLIQILNPPPPTQILKAAAKLTYRELITVHLMLNKPSVTTDSWVYVHDWRVGFGRLHEPKNWSKKMIPKNDQTSLVCEFWCRQGDSIWQKSDQDLINWTISDLSNILKFIKKEEVIDAFVVRTSKAYPVYKIGYKKPLHIVNDYLKKFSNLQLIGRYGTYKYNNMDHSMLSGVWAAKNIIVGKKTYDLSQINAGTDYHEEK